MPHQMAFLSCGSKTHVLKTWPEPFEAVLSGLKNFELRVNDRDFRVGDILCLQEFDPRSAVSTGREVKRRVSYMISGGEWGLPAHLCILSWEGSEE